MSWYDEWLIGLAVTVGIIKPSTEEEDDTEKEGGLEEPVLPEPEEEPEEEPEVLTRNPASRPQSWATFVGSSNQNTVDRLKMAIAAAEEEQRMLPHILLYGGPGLGKTTLARILSKETDSVLIETIGSSISKQQDIYSLFMDIENIQAQGKHAILFIDEIHDIAKGNAPETLWFPILEEYRFFHNLRNTKLIYDGNKYLVMDSVCELEPFTIIGATTDPGELSAPMRERFTISCYLNPYTVEDLQEILKRYSGRNDIKLEEKAARSLAMRARGTPRTAINLLMACQDRAVMSKTPITETVVNEQMAADDIDEEGLTRLDMKVLEALSKMPSKGLGISNLSGASGIKNSTIVEMVEPLLKQRGYMETTHKRFITTKGLKLLQKKVKK
jgi:Holliday junction DNA helicase RuvB